MEGNGGQFNLDRAKAALERAGAKRECPSCGHIEWYRNPDPVIVEEARPTVVDESGIPTAGELGAGIPAYALSCKRCGFMRLHNLKYLLAP
jgi:hypothetical protein